MRGGEEMKIKNIYIGNIKDYYVVEMPNNKFYKFYCTPSRKITEKDLTEIFPNMVRETVLKYLKPVVIEKTILKLYGLKKSKEIEEEERG